MEHEEPAAMGAVREGYVAGGRGKGGRMRRRPRKNPKRSGCKRRAEIKSEEAASRNPDHEIRESKNMR